MHNSVIVLLPPALVLFLAFTTKKLNLSLVIGLIVAGLIAADFAPLQTATLLGHRLAEQATDLTNIYNFLFLIALGIIIIILEYTGGAAAFAHLITQHLRTPRAVETASVALSGSLFVDDYLSSLTVGNVMRHLTDTFRIPRAKLAFLLRAMTGPIVILAPISSWTAMVTGQLSNAGISSVGNAPILADPFFAFVSSIPFIMYSLILIPSLFFIIWARISFGPMHTQEEIAHRTGNLFGGKQATEQPKTPFHESNSIADLLVPLATLIGTFFVGILYSGGFYLFGGNRTFVEVFTSGVDTAQVLCISGFVTLLVTIVFSLVRHKISANALPGILKNGTLSMRSSIEMLFLAITLGIMLRVDLLTGQYLANLLIGALSPIFLPAMFFCISTLIALAIGTAWGTITLMLPIAIPMTLQFAGIISPTQATDIALLFPVLGAIFSGAVAGNQLSPIADTTIIVSSSSGAYPLDHVQTQIPYIIPVLISAGVAFLLMGIFVNAAWPLRWGLPLLVGLAISWTLLYVCNIFLNKKRQ